MGKHQTPPKQADTISHMLFPGLDLNYIGHRFDTIAPAVVSASKGARVADPNRSPPILQQAMHRLIELLKIVVGQIEASPDSTQVSREELNELGDYGIQLLADFSSIASALNMSQQSQELEDLTLPMALWILRQHGELRTLEPVVNSLARLANSLREPSQLQQLYDVAVELLQAVEPTMQNDQEISLKADTRRILLMNQAIIATRSHQPALIDEAYQTLCSVIPDEAAQFFREGIEQMDALNYPQSVREVVEKYYNLWSLPRTLH
ncbi:MAG: hypothetical protein KZQ89_09100 [Candidatus Thiodiazotropha sp. (ex Lucinoma kastoroae)]|nr:hypothetical protein [Candidatus Thiodiazotropha sp. (ex Lucinoma kastoroae)]